MFAKVVDPTTGEVREFLMHKGRLQTVDGQELPDPKPIAPPVGYKKQPSMAELVRDMVRSERLRQEAESMGHESYEDADDFDVGDDYDPRSPYEWQFDPFVRGEDPPSQPGNPADESAAGGAEPGAGKPPRQVKKKAAAEPAEGEDED